MERRKDLITAHDALSPMYVGPQQRASMKAELYDRARKAGKSHNQAMGLAEKGVSDFMARIEAARRDTLAQALVKAPGVDGPERQGKRKGDDNE